MQSAALNFQAWQPGRPGRLGDRCSARRWPSRLTTARSPEAGYAYTNLHELNCASRRYAESGQYYLDGAAYCEEHDLGIYLCCLQGVRTATLDRLGRWDEAVTLSRAVLRRVLASPVNRMIPLGTLGRIRARRGEPGRLGVPGRRHGRCGRHRRSRSTSCPRG